MANRWRIKCLICNKQESFADTQDVKQSKWQILGWDVITAEPKAICPNCEYTPMEQKKKNEKVKTKNK